MKGVGKHEKYEEQDCNILEKNFLEMMKLELVCISTVARYGDNDDLRKISHARSFLACLIANVR